MTMVLVMLCGFLPALNVVGEKEAGTIEQINVTPVRAASRSPGKITPLLACRIHRVEPLHPTSLGWYMESHPKREYRGDLSSNTYFRSRRFRPGARDLQPLGNHATSHVRHVVLHAGIYPHERAIYPDQQHAAMGTIHHLRQSLRYFIGNHAHGLT